MQVETERLVINVPWASRLWERGKEDSVGGNLARGTRCGFVC